MIPQNNNNQEEIYYCDHCNKELEDNHSHIVSEMFDYCCDCYHDIYFQCENCGEDFEFKDGLAYYSEQYCKQCISELVKDGYIKNPLMGESI